MEVGDEGDKQEEGERKEQGITTQEGKNNDNYEGKKKKIQHKIGQ